VRAKDWVIPAVLTVFAIMPMIPGALRLVEFAGGPAIIPPVPRTLTHPIPVIAHIAASFFYTVFGAWQFSPALRRTPWHRRAGRALAGFGMIAALTGLYLTLQSPMMAHDNAVLITVRLFVGTGMVVFIGLALEAIIRRRDVPAHRAWMIRAYALGLGAASQMVLFMLLSPLGTPDPMTHALMLSAAWFINLGVAEWIIRRKPRPRLTPAAA